MPENLTREECREIAREYLEKKPFIFDKKENFCNAAICDVIRWMGCHANSNHGHKQQWDEEYFEKFYEARVNLLCERIVFA